MKSLKKDLNHLIKFKSCSCNPCTCSNVEKETFFQELKELLRKHNRDYTRHHFVIRENIQP